MGNGLGEVPVSLKVSCGPQSFEFALSPLALHSVRRACMEVQEPMTWTFELLIAGHSPFFTRQYDLECGATGQHSTNPRNLCGLIA